MSKVTPKICTPLYAPMDADGNIVFTCLSTQPEEARKQFLNIENTIRAIFKPGVPPAWEQYEAEGYRMIPVQVIPHPTLNPEHTCQQSFDV